MKHAVLVKSARMLAGLGIALALILSAGCPDAPPWERNHPIAPQASLASVNLSDPIRSDAQNLPILLHAARNEWMSFAVQVNPVDAKEPLVLRVGDLASAPGDRISSSAFVAYQVLSVPVQLNPDFVRRTGLNSANRSVPRVLLPVPLDKGLINLAGFRDPTRPENPSARPNGNSLLVWIDLHVPEYLPAGDYSGQIELLQKGRSIGVSLPIHLAVYDFALPEARHLQMAGVVDWERLSAEYPAYFGDTITPTLINRGDPRYRKTVAILDNLMALAERHRMSLAIPGLRPTVKWPAGQPPEIDWKDFDGLIGPWMSGERFSDAVPARFWMLPAAASLDRYDQPSRLAYWSQAAAHFQQMGWLERSPIWLDSLSSQGSRVQVTDEARQIASSNAKVCIGVPVEAAGLPAGLDSQIRSRLIVQAPSQISIIENGIHAGESEVARRCLRADPSATGLNSESGGDEQDVRAWAWLAFLRNADLIVWDHTLPAVDSPQAAADPNSTAWFYPGQWLGASGWLPTIQLEWLRRAQQDYEYLWLAEHRGELVNALHMARLMAKPVEIEPGQEAEPVYGLLTGTSSSDAWEQARELLAQTILQRQPGAPVDAVRQKELYIKMLQWAQPQERPELLPHGAQWTLLGPRKDSSGRSIGNWLALHFQLDIYDASDVTPESNGLQWDPPPPLSGWEMRPQPIAIPRLQTDRIQRATVDAQFNLDRISSAAGKPIELSYVNSFTRIPYPMQVRLPIAVIERHEGPLTLDGNLSDWSDADAIQDGPLVLMTSRPDLQQQSLRFAPGDAKIYTTWRGEHFYLAFSLDGLSPPEHQSHNDVYYQDRRAWGEDLSEVLIQPVYADNTLGAVLHVVCKPNGALWVDRKAAGSEPGDAWRTMEGAGIRYAASTGDDRWHGELGIPWAIINAPGKPIPTLLRFNFVQHRNQTCQSASWCGPVDYGRDENMMGVLYLKPPAE